MIRPLRQRHRFLLAILSILLPLAFALALFARKAPSRVQETSAVLRGDTPALPRVLFEKEDLWPDSKIAARVCADALPPAQLALELQPREDFKAPDVLVYWSPRNSGADEELLREAYLLGALAGKQKRRWLLPEAALQAEGALILYSLGHQQVLATTALPVAAFLKGGTPQ